MQKRSHRFEESYLSEENNSLTSGIKERENNDESAIII
jgi:hypothetical protein